MPEWVEIESCQPKAEHASKKSMQRLPTAISGFTRAGRLTQIRSLASSHDGKEGR